MTTATARYNLSASTGFNDIIKGNDIEMLNILKLNKVESRTANNSIYRVIRYDKIFLNTDLISSYGLCRSVIVNCNNKVVGFAPPKSIPCDEFIKKYNENYEG